MHINWRVHWWAAGLAKQKETDLPRGEQASQPLFQESRRAKLQEPIVDSADGYFEASATPTERCLTCHVIGVHGLPYSRVKGILTNQNKAYQCESLISQNAQLCLTTQDWS